MDDLTRVIWIYFNPGEDWTQEQIRTYTENWYAKTVYGDIENVPVHSGFSYAHHPELLGLTPLQSVFKLITATIPKEYDSLDQAIETANSINEDLDLGYATITEEGILRDNPTECQTLLTKFVVEMDMRLSTLESLHGVRFPKRNFGVQVYAGAFDASAREVYKVVTGRDCPEGLSTE